MNWDDIVHAITHPWTVIGAALAAFSSVPGTISSTLSVLVGVVPGLQALGTMFDVAFANAGSIFTATSVGSTTLATRIPWLPASLLEAGAVAAGGLMILRIGLRLYTQYQNRSDEQ